MPPVDLTGDVGAQLDLTADFEVADVSHLADFTRTLLTEESFEWEISGENLTVSAIGGNCLVFSHCRLILSFNEYAGIDVLGITLTAKTVPLKGMNGLKNGVTINSFDLPANDPAGGIHLTLNTTVVNVRTILSL